MVDLQTKRIQIAKHGVNKRDNPIDFAGDFTPYMKNFHIVGGVLKKFSGYDAYPVEKENYLHPIGISFSKGGGIGDFHHPNGSVYSVIGTRRDFFTINGDFLRQATEGAFVDHLESGWTDAHGDLTLDHFNSGNTHGMCVRVRNTGSEVSSDATKIGYIDFESIDLHSYSYISGWIKVSGLTFSDDHLSLVLSESANGAKAGTYVEVDIPIGEDVDYDDDTWYFFSVPATLTDMDAAVSIGIWNNTGVTWPADSVVYLKDISCNTPMTIDYKLAQKVRFTESVDTNEFTKGKALVVTNGTDDLQYFDGAPVSSGNRFSDDANCVAAYKFDLADIKVDYVGNNSFINSYYISLETDIKKRGASSAYFWNSSSILYLPAYNQESGFPLKTASDKTFSFTFWIRFKNVSIDRKILGLGETALLDLGILVGIKNSKLYVEISSDGEDGTEYSHGSTLSVDTWYHVGVTYNGGGDDKLVIRIWDDTAKAILGTDIDTVTIDINAADNAKFTVGKDVFLDNFSFLGYLDELAVFKDVLSSDEIDEIRNSAYNSSNTAPAFSTLVHSFTNFDNCRDIVEYWNHLMMVGYVLSTGDYLQSVEFSGAGDVDDHTTVSSGNFWLSDAVGILLRAIKLGSSLVIFTPKSILITNYYGTAVKFTTLPKHTSLGLIGPNAVCVAEDTAFFIGSDKRVYLYELNSGIEEVGGTISDDLSSLNTTSSYDFVAFYDGIAKRVYAGVNSNGVFKGYGLNLKGLSPAWEYYEFDNDVDGFLSGLGFANDPSSYNSPKSIFLSSDGYLFELKNEANEGSFLMNSGEISCEYQTEDISVNDELEYARFQEFIFTAKSSLASSSVTVEYSVDNGSSWSSVEESPIYLENDEWKTYQCHLDKVSRVIRFRFTNTSKDLQIKNDMFVRFIPEGVEGID